MGLQPPWSVSRSEGAPPRQPARRSCMEGRNSRLQPVSGLQCEHATIIVHDEDVRTHARTLRGASPGESRSIDVRDGGMGSINRGKHGLGGTALAGQGRAWGTGRAASVAARLASVRCVHILVHADSELHLRGRPRSPPLFRMLSWSLRARSALGATWSALAR